MSEDTNIIPLTAAIRAAMESDRVPEPLASSPLPKIDTGQHAYHFETLKRLMIASLDTIIPDNTKSYDDEITRITPQIVKKEWSVQIQELQNIAHLQDWMNELIFNGQLLLNAELENGEKIDIAIPNTHRLLGALLGVMQRYLTSRSDVDVNHQIVVPEDELAQRRNLKQSLQAPSAQPRVVSEGTRALHALQNMQHYLQERMAYVADRLQQVEAAESPQSETLVAMPPLRAPLGDAVFQNLKVQLLESLVVAKENAQNGLRQNVADRSKKLTEDEVAALEILAKRDVLEIDEISDELSAHIAAAQNMRQLCAFDAISSRFLANDLRTQTCDGKESFFYTMLNPMLQRGMNFLTSKIHDNMTAEQKAPYTHAISALGQSWQRYEHQFTRQKDTILAQQCVEEGAAAIVTHAHKERSACRTRMHGALTDAAYASHAALKRWLQDLPETNVAHDELLKALKAAMSDEEGAKGVLRILGRERDLLLSHVHRADSPEAMPAMLECYVQETMFDSICKESDHLPMYLRSLLFEGIKTNLTPKKTPKPSKCIMAGQDAQLGPQPTVISRVNEAISLMTKAYMNIAPILPVVFEGEDGSSMMLHDAAIRAPANAENTDDFMAKKVNSILHDYVRNCLPEGTKIPAIPVLALPVIDAAFTLAVAEFQRENKMIVFSINDPASIAALPEKVRDEVQQRMHRLIAQLPSDTKGFLHDMDAMLTATHYLRAQTKLLGRAMPGASR